MINLRPNRLFACLLLAFICFATVTHRPALAQTQFQINTADLKILHILHLSNGDRLSGRIVAETEREVTLLNSTLGQIVVRKSDIRMREEVNIDAPQLGVSAQKTTNA